MTALRKVNASVGINTPALTVFNAFLKHDILCEWWAVERSLIEERENGIYALAWGISDAGLSYVTTGIIRVFRPYSELLIDKLCYLNPSKPIFGPMSLHISIHEKGPGSILELTQDGYQRGEDWDWYYNIVKEAWPVVLQSLKNCLERN